MISIAELETICSVSTHSSLAAVARALNISQPGVSQRISALERKLQVRLVERSGRAGLILTTDGARLARRAFEILSDVDVAISEIAESRREVQGHINIFAPLGFGRAHVASAVADFQKRHQEVSINLTLSDSLGELPRSPWDLIIHVGPLRESSLVGITLAPNQRFLCAAPKYFESHGFEPRQPQDLTKCKCLTIHEDSEDACLWTLISNNQQCESTNIRVDPTLSSNDGDVVRGWMLDGMGIAQRSEWSVAEDLRAGRLIRILTDYTMPDAPVVALVSTRKERASRVQAFINHLRGSLTPTPWRQIS